MNGAVAGGLLAALAIAARLGLAPGVCLVVATFVWLACLPRTARLSPTTVVVVAVLLRLTFVGSAYRTDDLHRYVWEGRAQIAGFSPYIHAPNDPHLASLGDPVALGVNHPYHASIYPPLAQATFATAAAIGLREEGFRLLFVAVDIGVVLASMLWLRALRRPLGHAAVYAWSPLAVVAAGSGHLDPLALLPMLLAFACFARGRVALSGALLGAATLAKVFPIVLLPWLLLRGGTRVLAAFAVVVGVGWLAFAAGDLFAPLRNFAASYQFHASLYALVGEIAPNARFAVVGCALALAVAVASVHPSAATHAVVALGALLLLSPTVHAWYLTWVLAPAAVAMPSAWSAIVCVWCAATSVALYPTYRDSFVGLPFVEYGAAVAFGYGVPAVAAVALVALAYRRRPTPIAPANVSTPRAMSTFAVVVPAYRELANLRELLPRWLATDAVCVVVADTPTNDGTESLVAGDPRLRYVPVRRRGYGAAVRAGIAAIADDPALDAGVDVVVVCDADHALGPEQVDALLSPFEDPDVALVTAARRASAPLTLPQRLGNGATTAAIAFCTGRWFHDLGPFRALRRRHWPAGHPVDDGYGINVEMNVAALQRGHRVVEVALPSTPRVHGENRISTSFRGVVGAGRGMLSRLVRMCLRPCPPASSS